MANRTWFFVLVFCIMIILDMTIPRFFDSKSFLLALIAVWSVMAAWAAFEFIKGRLEK